MAEHTYTTGGPGVAVLLTITSNAAAAVAKVLRLTNQTTVARDGSGIWTVTPANEEDSAEFYTFLEAALPVGSSSVVEATRVRENGTSIGGGTSGGTQYMLAVAGPVENNGAGADRKIGVFCVTVDPSSGSWTQKAGDPTAPTIVLKSFAPSVAHTLGFALVDAISDGTNTLYEMGSGNITVAANSQGTVDFITKYTA
jgi:hypothetical protein